MELYQFEILQSYYSSWNQALKEQLTGTVINQKLKYRVFRYLDYLIDPSYQGVNRLFVLSILDGIACRIGNRIFSSKCTNKRLQCYD